jgi:hypothetical protein
MSGKEGLELMLTVKGFDGLYFPGECACKKSDIGSSCDGEGPFDDECIPGYLQKMTQQEEEEHGFVMGAEKQQTHTE